MHRLLCQPSPTATNYHIQPETIDTYELAFDLQPTKDLNSTLNFFFYQAEDIIVPMDDGSGGIPQSQNTEEQEGYGFEIEVDWKYNEIFKIRTYLAYQNSENKNSEMKVPDVPELQFYINPHWEIYLDWSFDAQYYWIGNQHRFAENTREDIDDYGRVNLTLRRKNIGGLFDAALAVRNLFDEEGRTPSPYDSGAPEGAFIPNDYPIEGRSIWFELRCSF